MRYKLAGCGCLTDADGYVASMCQTHRAAVTVAVTQAENPFVRPPVRCPLGHLMTYAIEDDRFHCPCGAVASSHGTLIVDPDPVER
jgi:folate-dependent tRNA-U54 methylase TrmFO/GidA